MGKDQEANSQINREIKPVKKLADKYTECCKNIIGLSLLQVAISFAILAIGISCYIQFKFDYLTENSNKREIIFLGTIQLFCSLPGFVVLYI